MPTVKDILKSKGSRVDHIGPNATVLDALKLMSERNVGALVVLDAGRLVGIISERDYARKIILKGRTSLDTKVSEIMSPKVICASPGQCVHECLAIMTQKSVRHLPVLEQKVVVGVISIGDLVKTIIAEQTFVIEQLETYIQTVG